MTDTPTPPVRDLPDMLTRIANDPATPAQYRAPVAGAAQTIVDYRRELDQRNERVDQLIGECEELRSLCGKHDPTGADHMEDAARLAEENDDLREAVNALSDALTTVWVKWRTTAQRPEDVPVDDVVDRLTETEAVALNAALGKAYGSRPELGWEGGHPVAAAIYLAANEGEHCPGTEGES